MSNNSLFIHESSVYFSLLPIPIHTYIPTEIFCYGSKNAIFIIGWNQVIALVVFFSFSLLILQCIERNLAISNASYLDWLEKTCPEPSLRLISNRLLTDDDIQFTFDTIESISSELLPTI